ncbi:DeoR family transcriptional regulator [[Haemophilus] felis]|uniref:DeoR family transcriptional regulator n=1 Tax=[Haemophilus] felis TaxID=123822 RepID=A0A1T0AX81_9PAST|nr:DeoR family transcriptional regulator [[Haemophilus] felis]
MIPAERQKKILFFIQQEGIVSIAKLVEMMNVSHMTIRRDIQKLEELGKVVSVSGGVQLLERLVVEPTHDDKSLLFHSEKQQIGIEAAKHIPQNSTVYLDAGTTTLQIAKHISHRDDLLIITNDFVIANFLIENAHCEVIHTGGRICKENHSSVGELTAQFLRSLSIDVSFISTSSWNLQGLTTPDEQKIPVKRAILQVSQKNILVTDSSKYGKVATFHLYSLDNFDRIICDKHLLANVQEKIKSMDVCLSLI